MGSAGRIPHIVVGSVEPWGHARSLCAFACRVVLMRDVYVTLITPSRVLDRVTSEVSRAFRPEAAERRKFIRILALDNAVEGISDFASRLKAEQDRYFGMFMDEYHHLLKEEPVTCAITKTEYPGVTEPTMLVIDFLLGSLIDMVRNTPNNHAKIMNFASGMASFLFTMFAPLERKGRGNFQEKVLKEVQKSGKPLIDVANELVYNYNDEVCYVPGLPDVYYWEFDPQDTKFFTGQMLGLLFMSLSQVYEHADGLIMTSPEAYEPEGITATREWFADTKRPAWAVGPLNPPANTKEAIAGEEAICENFDEIKSFMDNIQKTRGEQSVIYISFGSAFWPPTLEHVETFLDVLIERNIPFLFSHASPVAQIPDALNFKVRESGIGLLTRWSPQQTILVHPALGWFVTHGGHNSTLEAISSAVPMICWPFHMDQPLNSTRLCLVHDVAYELTEVRTGNGLKPILRTGKAPTATLDAVRAEANEILDKAFGEDGARKRANIQKLKGIISDAWADGGSAAVDMARLLDTL